MSGDEINRAVSRLGEAKTRYEAEQREKAEAERRAREAAQECGAAAGRRWVYELASYPQCLKLTESRAKPNALTSNPRAALGIADDVWASLITGEHDPEILSAAFGAAACEAWQKIEPRLQRPSPLAGNGGG